MPRETTNAEIERLRLENEQLFESQRLAEEMRDRYMDLYDHAPLAYVTLDGVGTISEVNQAAVALLGRSDSRHHVVGRRLKDLVMESDQATLTNHLRQCPIKRDPVACEVRLRDSTLVQLWSRRIRLGLRLYPTVIIDLREREHAAEETRRLLAAEKALLAASDAKDHFIATLSHELRTPLTPVLAAVTALRERPGIPDNLRAIHEMIRRNIMTEARLIDDLLDVTRITRGKIRLDRQAVDVHETVREATETLGVEIAAKHLKVGVLLEAEHHCANADPVKLKQVFWNLLRNAVKFTPEGGQIDLRSWNNAGSDSRWLAVEVSDTGKGFDPAAGPGLFEAFEQGIDAPERSGGLGLGLAICKGMMLLHGGRIAAISRGPGLGARFVVEIETIDDVPVAVEAPPVAPPELPYVRPRLLLVDDHEDTAEMLGELLTDAGFEVRTAHSVQEALGADLDNVDLLISDIGLPDASGLDLIRRIRATRPLKGVALSGYGTEADIRASIEAGFSAHLTKPVDFERLLATIRDVSASAPS